MELVSIFYLIDIIFLTILFCKYVSPILLQYVAQTIFSIENYCKTEFIKFEKLERNKMSRKQLRNYGQYGQDLRVISREIRLSILNDQSKFCKH